MFHQATELETVPHVVRILNSLSFENRSDERFSKHSRWLMNVAFFYVVSPFNTISTNAHGSSDSFTACSLFIFASGVMRVDKPRTATSVQVVELVVLMVMLALSDPSPKSDQSS